MIIFYSLRHLFDFSASLFFRLARTMENKIIESTLPGIRGEEAEVSRVLLTRIRENLELSGDQF